VTLLDTHVWIWWVSNPENLSETARRRIEQSMKNETLLISSISAWEVAMLKLKGRLELTLDVADWIAKSEALPFVKFAPVTNSIAVRAVQLPGTLHADPADRIIAATAMINGSVLVTKDEKLANYPFLETLW